MSGGSLVRKFTCPYFSSTYFLAEIKTRINEKNTKSVEAG